MKLKPTIRSIDGWQEMQPIRLLSKVRSLGYDKPLTRTRIIKTVDAMLESAPKKPKAKNLEVQAKVSKKNAKLPKVIKFGDPKHATEGFGWLSNMLPCCIYLKVPKGFGTNGFMMFYSAEQAFQWAKTISADSRSKIANCIKPKDARYHGSERAGCVLRDEWSEEGFKESVMFEILKSKYSQNKVLCKMLLGTGNVPLYEVAPWDKQKFWGVDDNLIGENKTASLIMKVRKSLSEEVDFYTGTLK